MRRFQSWLDGIDTVASAFYLVIVMVMAGVAVGVFFGVFRDFEFSWGSQGEMFYLALALLLVLGWVLGQLAFLLNRRRRSAWVFEDGSEIPLPKFERTPEGFKASWGGPAGAPDAANAARTWNFSFGGTSARARTRST
jgi:hypothetical protein